MNYNDPSGLESCECTIIDATNMTKAQRDKAGEGIAKYQKHKLFNAVKNNTNMNAPAGIAIDGKYASKLAFGRTQEGLQGKIKASENIAKATAVISATLDKWGFFGKSAKKASDALGYCAIVNAQLLKKEKNGELDESSILTDLYTNLTTFVKNPFAEAAIDEATGALSSEIFSK